MGDQCFVNICESLAAWEQRIVEATSQSRLVVVDCMARWCGPCKYMRPHFDNLSRRYPHVLFLRVDIDQLRSLAIDMDIQGFPTFIFIKNGREIERLLGANKEELQQKVALHAQQMNHYSHALTSHHALS
ncbi:hypothetical protein KP509_03G081700 [Ceratopteris richardii]|uniref:Thioredoxin domain-containing protein n=1 Tax=Ceratopteris richardii TaxID=49495 RepID=A0A8T2V9E1_CERRI|nr:hypothetical protein KP509_03G081700 [Ceratopteris richardii]